MAERLEFALDLRGLDQSALASDLGVTQGAISKIVRGHTRNSRLAPRIAHRLHVPLPWLLGETDDRGFDVEPGSDLDEDEWALVNLFRQMPEADRAALLHIAQSMVRTTRVGTLHAPNLNFRAEGD